MLFPCPKCNATIEALDDASGQQGTCPHCAHTVTVPIPPAKTVLRPARSPWTSKIQPRAAIGKFLSLLRHNRKAQVCTSLLAINVGIFLWHQYSVYQERVAVERAEAERVARVIQNTPIIWSEYRNIKSMRSAALSLDDIQSVRIKADKMRKLLDYDIDSDLRTHIQARVRLIDSSLSIWDDALTQAKKIENERTVGSFFAGMLGGVLVPEDPVRAGMAFGQASYASGQNKADKLADQIRQSIQALQEEDKQLDAYEPKLEALLAQRYR